MRQEEGARPAAGGGPLGVGQWFGTRYHVIKLLGSGGMGEVYQAWDEELGVAVALKVIRPESIADPDMAAALHRRFKRELLLARQVTHRNVVRIHDLGELDGIKYITMPYIAGADLATVLRREGRIPVPRALRIARQVAAGLAAAHEAGVVHRDLKPPNIMIDPDDNAVIMDFGIARSVDAGSSTVAGVVVGTLAYMAPEQARGEEADQRADIYAFGLILYDMLVGRRQTAGSSSALADLVARMQQAPPPIRTLDPGIPEPLEQIVSRCLETDRANRYQTMGELIADLDALDPDGHRIRPLTPAEVKQARRTQAFQRKAAGSPAGRWKLAAAGAALLLVAGAALFLLRGRSAGRAAAPTVGAGQAVSLAILPFRNASGDSSLDWLGPSLSEMLRTDVGRSAKLQTVASDRLNQILRDLRISADSTFDPATLRKLADFSNADTILWGQYLKFGEEIRIDATLVDVRRQRSVPLKAQAPSQSGLLAAVDQLAQSIRESLSFSGSVLEELKATAFKPSTQSLEALRAYNEGLQLARQDKNSEALKKFQASIRADPEFALAYAKLGQSYASLGYDAEAEQNSRRAVELAERLPAQEKYVIAAGHAKIANDTGKAIEAYENLAKVSPEDPEVNFELAALYESSGAFDQARAHYKKVLERDPKSVAALLASGRVEIKGGNPQASLDSLNRALSLAIQLENDEQKADVLHAIGVAYKRLDKPKDALRYYQESLEIKRRIGGKRGIAVTLGEMAQVQKRLGNPDAALASLKEALQIQREIGDKKGIATTLITARRFLRGPRGLRPGAAELQGVAADPARGRQSERRGALPEQHRQHLPLQGAVRRRADVLRAGAPDPREDQEPRRHRRHAAQPGGDRDEQGSVRPGAEALPARASIRRDAGNKRGAAIESHNMGTRVRVPGAVRSGGQREAGGVEGRSRS